MTTGSREIETASEELRMVLGRLVRRLRAENSVPLRQATVLGLIERAGPLTTSDLARHERMRPQSMAETIKELEADGLVTRQPDSADGRRQLVALTQAGRDTLRRDRARREEWLANAISRELTQREQKTLADAIALLRRLADS